MKVLCECGYIREGLEPTANCPECGELRIAKQKLSIKQNWAIALGSEKAAFVFAVIAAFLSSLSSIAWIWLIVLVSSAKVGGTAGIALMYPILGVVLCIPFSLLAMMLGIIQYLVKPSTLSRIAVCSGVFSGVLPGVIMFFSTDEIYISRLIAICISAIFLFVGLCLLLLIWDRNRRLKQ